MMKRILALLALLSGGCANVSTALAQYENQVPFYSYRVVNTYPHDAGAFTQGLFIHDGALYESTGKYGKSHLYKKQLETGEQLQALPLSNQVFGEGSTLLDGKIYVLTWRSGAGLVVDAETFKPERTFKYQGEGWGLTHDGERLIMSDGTSELRFLDPETLEETGRLEVTHKGKPLRKLNELEFIKGEIFANIWQSDAIVRIDPETGKVTGILDMRGLLSDEERRRGQTDVLNGIAYDAEENRLFVTGKNWPKLFEIELAPRR